MQLLGTTAEPELEPRAPVSSLEPRDGALVALAWLIFGLAHTLARLAIPSQLAPADALSMLAAQKLVVAYQVGQPPLFDWSVWAVQQLLGPTAFSIYLTKYAFMGTAGMFVYWATLAATAHARAAAVASLSLMLLFNVGMTSHDQSTHSVALIAALAATFHFFIMLAKRAAWRDYIGLGLSIAAGTLSKYGYLIMPVAFSLAFLASPRLRDRILCARFALALALATALALPFAVWLVLHFDQLVARTSSELIELQDAPYLTRVGSALTEFAYSFAVYCLPAMPVLWILFPRLLTRGPTRLRVQQGRLPDVIGLALIIGVAIAILLILASGIDVMRSRYMHVLALLVPTYAAMYVQPEELTRRRFAVFLGIVAVLQFATFAPRAVTRYFPVSPICSKCAVVMPIESLAGEIARRGYGQAAFWVGNNAFLGGNLRRHLPSAIFRTSSLRPGAQPASDGARVCIAVLEAETREGARIRVQSTAGLEDAPNEKRVEIVVDWAKPLVGTSRSTTWFLQELEANDRRCVGQGTHR
jgi:4-amino-4-deoxy-L-arabinose transferase-like glycosyltransferase